MLAAPRGSGCSSRTIALVTQGIVNLPISTSATQKMAGYIAILSIRLTRTLREVGIGTAKRPCQNGS